MLRLRLLAAPFQKMLVSPTISGDYSLDVGTTTPGYNYPLVVGTTTISSDYSLNVGLRLLVVTIH